MKNMKQKMNEKIRNGMQKAAVNMGEGVIEGRNCRGLLYEPEIPVELLKKQAKKGF